MNKSCFAVLCLLLIVSCTKNVNPPSVITLPVTEVTWEYAVSGGEVIDDGGSPVTARGICATETDYAPPSLDSEFEIWYTSDSSGLGSFVSIVPAHWHGAALSIRCTTYFRAYATNEAGTAYGELFSFYPKSQPPAENAIEIHEITASVSTATVSYSTEPFTRYEIDEVGICYSTNPNPTIEGTHVTGTVTLGVIESVIIEDLLPDMVYYIRGYVKNESGISYSSEVNFTTGRQ